MVQSHVGLASLLGVSVFLAACGGAGSTGPTLESRVRSVSVSGPIGGLIPGQTAQFTAHAYDSTYTVLPTQDFRWWSSDTTIAEVSATGLVTAVSPGSVNIIARIGAVQNGANLSVLEPVASAKLGAVRAAVTPGASFRLPLALRSAANDSLTARLRSLSWTSSDPSVAQVDTSGLITTAAPGTTTITVTAVVEGVSSHTDLSVMRLRFMTAQDGGGLRCGLTTGKRVYCWPNGNPGDLGNAYLGEQADGTVLVQPSPWPVNTDVLFDSLAVGDSHICALTASGQPYCWGINNYGQLGDGTTTSRVTPAPVAGGLTLSVIAVGINYTCGLQPNAAAVCWGWNGSGNMGTGDGQTTSLVPRASAAGIQFRTISLSPYVQTGGPHTCGMSIGGDAYCWGDNEWGQVGTYPRTPVVNSPALVLSPTTLVDVQSGGQHSCGLAADGTVLCWGDNEGNALGDRQLSPPDIDSIPAPVPNAPPLVQVRSALYRNFGLTSAGDVYCWGDVFGKTPLKIRIPQPITRIDISSQRFCGMSIQGVAWCWPSSAGLTATMVEGQ